MITTKNGAIIEHADQDTAAPHILREMFDEDVYRLGEMEGNDLTILDVGGNIGVFSVFAAPRAKQIVAIEPIRENIATFKTNIAVNGLEGKVQLIEGALMPSEGTVQMQYFDYTRGSSRLNPHGDVTVQGVTLAQVVMQCGIPYFDFLKMDIEGAEYPLLMAWGEAEFSRFGRIAMEWHNSNDVDFFNFLNHLGRWFKHIQIIGQVKHGGYLYATKI